MNKQNMADLERAQRHVACLREVLSAAWPLISDPDDVPEAIVIEGRILALLVITAKSWCDVTEAIWQAEKAKH